VLELLNLAVKKLCPILLYIFLLCKLTEGRRSALYERMDGIGRLEILRRLVFMGGSCLCLDAYPLKQLGMGSLAKADIVLILYFLIGRSRFSSVEVCDYTVSGLIPNYLV
jgi:hypothetical protein